MLDTAAIEELIRHARERDSATCGELVRDFEQLWQSFIDGVLDERGFAALDQMLADDPALTALAADLYAEHRLLSLALHDSSAETLMSAGHAVRFTRANAASEAVAVQTEHYNDVLHSARQRPNAELLRTHESFDYTLGKHALGELTGGIGWAGPWRKRTLADGGTAYSGTSRDMIFGAGGWLTPAGKTFRACPLAEPLDMARDGIMYVSMVVHEPVRVPDGEFTESLQLTFRSSAQFADERVNLRLSAGLRPIIETGKGQGFVSRVAVKDAQTLLLVAKIVARRSGEDEVSMRVFGSDETPDIIEPATWDVSTRGLNQSARLDLLTVQSSGNASRTLDEIRIGPTWRSVVNEK